MTDENEAITSNGSELPESGGLLSADPAFSLVVSDVSAAADATPAATADEDPVVREENALVGTSNVAASEVSPTVPDTGDSWNLDSASGLAGSIAPAAGSSAPAGETNGSEILPEEEAQQGASCVAAAEVSETSAATNARKVAGLPGSAASTAPDPARTVGLDELLMGPEDGGAPHEPGREEPNLPQSGSAPKDEPNAQCQTYPDSRNEPGAESSQVKRDDVITIEERMRQEDGTLNSSKFAVRVPFDAISAIRTMFDCDGYAHDQSEYISFPTDTESYGTTGELFAKIERAIREQTYVSHKDCSLATYWLFTTTVQNFLPVAPGLAITGCAHEADLLLRTLAAFCRHPVLLAGLTSTTLDNIPWELTPTLLINEPFLSPRMAHLLSSSAGHGYLAGINAGGFSSTASRRDYFGSKAVYVGEDPSARIVLTHYLRVNASPALGAEAKRPACLSRKMIQSYQNQMLTYRIRNLARVAASDFNVSELSPELNAIATAFGKSIVDAPELQAKIASLLRPRSEQQLAERRDSQGLLVISAALSLCHQGKEQVRAEEIATEGNRMLKASGERFQLNAERVGRTLKKTGIPSRRLGSAGNGLLFDRATRVLLHEAARAYGCAGLTESKESLQCPLCLESK